MKIGERIKQSRVELGLSVNDVASALGKSRSTIYRYENNAIENIPIAILNPLAELLQSDPAIFIGDTMPKKTHSRYENDNSDKPCKRSFVVTLRFPQNVKILATVQAVSEHEAVGKVLEIIPTATYENITEIEENV